MADAIARGATALCGGRRHALGGNSFDPTVLVGARPDMVLAHEQTFWPLAPVFSFDSEDEAITLANDTESGLPATSSRATSSAPGALGKRWSAATNSAVSWPLSAPTVAPGLLTLRSIIRIAASHLARPVACVLSTSTTSPLRFPASACVLWRSYASANSPFLGGVAARLALEVGFRVAPGRRVRTTAVLGHEALVTGPGLDIVPSTLMCPSDTKPCHSARCSTRRKNRRATSVPSRRSRLMLKTVRSHTTSSMPRPTNQRNSSL